MDEPIVAYVAGVIDARAHIEIGDRGNKAQPRLSVTTNKVALLDHLAMLTGTKVSLDDRGYQRRPCGDHCTAPHSHVVRQSSKWRCDSSRATILLFNILPYMVAQREDALAALTVGLNAYPAARGDTAKQMAKLGWRLPPGPLSLVKGRTA